LSQYANHNALHTDETGVENLIPLVGTLMNLKAYDSSSILLIEEIVFDIHDPNTWIDFNGKIINIELDKFEFEYESSESILENTQTFMYGSQNEDGSILKELGLTKDFYNFEIDAHGPPRVQGPRGPPRVGKKIPKKRFC
jgi:hypothetical protein